MLSTWKSCCSSISQKWVFTIVTSVGLCVATILRVLISITIIEMVMTTENPKQNSGSCKSLEDVIPLNRTLLIFRSENDTLLGKRFSWDSDTQGIILSSFSWSYTIAQCFYGSLAERFGGKHLLGFGILIQAVLTFITPLATDWGDSTALIVTRVLIGIANAGTYPLSNTLVSHWTTPKDRTKIGNIIYCGPHLGTFIGIMTAPLVIKYVGIGWPGAYYAFGVLGMIWFPFWLLFVYEDPESHPFISDQEKKYLLTCSEEEKVHGKLPPAPWRKIFSCKEFWVFTISIAGNSWAYFAMLNNLPMYMGTVVNFSLENNGYFSALPYLFLLLNIMVSTYINDKILEKKWMSLTNVRKLFATVSIMGPAIFLLLASYAECDKTLVVISFLIGITLMGSLYPSVMMNALDLSPNYAGSLMAVGNGLGASIGIVVPYIIGKLTPNSTLGEWRLVFWIVFVFSALSNIVYLIWFKAEVQPWNDSDTVKSRTEIIEMKKKADRLYE